MLRCRRVDYKLSDLGETMRPIIAAMETWGRGYQEIVRRTAELDLRAAD